jgi:Nif-specific regulatory protein
MLNCHWPGNVRELENCVERTATMTHGEVIHDLDLPCQQGKCLSMVLQSYGGNARVIPIIPETVSSTPGDTAPVTERERLMWAMEKCGWVQAKAARLLDMTPRQIGYALKKYNIPMKRM